MWARVAASAGCPVAYVRQRTGPACVADGLGVWGPRASVGQILTVCPLTGDSRIPRPGVLCVDLTL